MKSSYGIFHECSLPLNPYDRLVKWRLLQLSQENSCYLTEDRILLTSQLTSKELVLREVRIAQILICTNTT